MHKQQNSLRLFRLLATFAVIALIFSQFVSTAQAQEPLPPTKEPLPQVTLDELESYYGRLANRQGPVGIVVELKDIPSALVYAEALRQPNAATLSVERTQQQTIKIQQAQATFTRTLGGLGVQANELYRTQKVYNGIWMRVQPEDVAKIASIRGVKAIHPMIPKTIDHTTSVPLIGAPQVWAGLGGYLGEDISVGVIDTGIDYVHTNFGGGGVYTGQDYTVDDEAGGIFPSAKVVGGYDFAGDAYDADPNSATYNPNPTPDPDPMDCNGHGSHVSGTVGGYGVLADGSTYTETPGDTYANLSALSAANYIAKFRIGPGVAPKVSLYGLRVFGCNGSTDLTEQAIEWAMDPDGDGDVSDHLDVINMSLGSSYGSPYDTSAVAANNAVEAGVIVVASAGNSGDSYYVTGSPAAATYAISVASSVDSGAIVSAFEVSANTATTPVVPVGTYPAAGAGFGPQTFAQSGALAYFSPTDLGCSAYAAGTFTGKIALINRGTCNFTVKVKNAQTAGAVGVLVANNVDTAPADMGGADATVTIPSMITTKALGTALRTDMAAGTVTVLLTTAHRNAYFMSLPAFEDNISSFSSRGPARAGTLLKPDITAPGDTIFSTANGTGNEGASFNGTSMASPHMAGVMALLREQHSDWTVAELKALAMNTATNDLYTGLNKAGNKHTPTRVGAGRVNVANAVQSDVVAYYADDPGQVSVAFGEMALASAETFTQSITLDNKNALDAEYDVTFDSRYPVNPGLTFSLLDEFDETITGPVTVPGSGTLEIKVQVDVDPAQLTKTIDATIATGARERFSEGGGYVTLTSTGSQTLRVPVHIAARPASTMSVAETDLILPAAATGTVSLTPTGEPVATADDASLVYITELLYTSPDEASDPVSTDSADLKYVGASSDLPAAGSFAGASMYFSLATYGKWDTLHAPEFDIYIDVNEDGKDDYVLYNYHTGTSSSPTDTMFSVICRLQPVSCSLADYINWFGGSTNTNTYNNNVMTMDVPLTAMGLVNGVNTDFDFYVVTFHRDAADIVDSSPTLHYDVAKQSFDTSSTWGIPVWEDDPSLSPTFDIGYNKANIALNQSKGLLFLHTHNTEATTAQTLLLPYAQDFAKTSPADGATGQSASLFLSWEASSGATSYEYCIAITAEVCTNWIPRGTALYANVSGLSPNTTYYWQVRAKNSLGLATYANGSETGHWSFTTVAVPGVFNLTTPVDGATGQPTNLTLTWAASEGATSYEYCLVPTGVACTTWIPRSSSRYATVSGLSPLTTYDWLVRARNSFGVTYANGSDTSHWSFTTVAVPGVFNLTAPVDGATGQPASLTLTWAASEGATSYEYCLVPTGVACTTWIPRSSSRYASVSGLSPLTTYDWLVRARNSYGVTYANGSDTSHWSFTTVAVPGVFNLTTPVDGATGQPASLTLTWAASEGATSYEYCLVPTGVACTTWIPRSSSRYASVSGLSPLTTYDWLVRARNSYGVTYANGSDTSHWSFTTVAVPGVFNLTAPVDGATGQPTSLTLTWAASEGATSYEYCLVPTGVACTTWIPRSSSRYASVSGLSPLTTYDWQVRARNSFGVTYANTGPWSFTTK